MHFLTVLEAENSNVLVTGRNEVLAKVIFSQASVCPRRGVSQHALQVSPGGVSNFLGGLSLIFRGGRGSPIFRGGGHQTPEYGQRSAGTHPTGMHSCLSSIVIHKIINPG